MQFYCNPSNLLASVAAAPYAFVWTNVGAGSYSLLARVVFNGSASNDSSGGVITVSNAVVVAPVIAAGSVLVFSISATRRPRIFRSGFIAS